MSDDRWYQKTVAAVADAFDSDPETGISEEEVENRRKEYGSNTIDSDSGVNPLALLIEQFQDFLIYLLLAAAFVSIAVGYIPGGGEPKWFDAGLILAIVIGDALFGFWQNYKVEESMEALKDLSSPDATVIRDGQTHVIDSEDVVPGDIIIIEQGDAIPADARLIEATNLEIDESALTGESVEVSKYTETIDEETPLADRDNMVYKNTTAVKGRGKAIVTETGMDTQVGDIAEQIAEADEKKTPFQREVDELGKKLGYLTLGVIGLVAIIQFLFTGASTLTIFLVAISLAVAAVPEALPAVVTLSLVLGSNKMLEKDALVRRISVVETLGSVDVIVTDKTGTLTRDKMTVERVWADDTAQDISYDDGEPSFEDGRTSSLETMLASGYLCNNAERTKDDDYRGDPTEIALFELAEKADVTPDKERVHEIPFSSERKRMTTIHEDDAGGNIAYMKGAPSYVLERCDSILINGEKKELTDEWREKIKERQHAFAKDALRVLAFAQKRVEDPEADDDQIETEMTFLGLQGMIDPPREEVKEAVEDCRSAGIKVIMATGDNRETAKAIGRQVGFDDSKAITGQEVEEMSDEELQEAVEETEIFARVSPAHKVRIQDALQANGHRVAMTGDGVNDAPALKNSDVGISMGQRGTDVAKQSSDMILQDDNFVTIRDAIAEGRNVFDNIREFIGYIVGSNTGEVMIVFLGTILGSLLYPDLFGGEEAVVVTAVMLLYINLVTDGLPALGLGLDSKPDDIMEREPRGAGEPVIDKRMLAWIGGMGPVITIGILPFYFLHATESLLLAQTFAFTALNLFEMTGMQIVRKIYGMDLFDNFYVNASIVMVLVLQAIILYVPQAASVFGVTALPVPVVGQVLAAIGIFIFLSVGLAKYLDYKFGAR